jgi:hypothetical protein
MMKKVAFLFAAALVLAVSAVGAQEPVAEVDSVMLTGRVVNHHTHHIYPNCYMRFVQDGRTVAETTTDGDGEFIVSALPMGRVELHVKLKGLLLHQADFDLYENADLTVAVDTIKLVTLKAITVVAAKHMLGSLQIKSRHDNRLWGIAGRRNANANVAMPPDFDGTPQPMACGLPRKIRVALTTGTLGTTLLTPPIWEVVPDRIVKADSTQADTPVSE